jgi:hypothetical protein
MFFGHIAVNIQDFFFKNHVYVTFVIETKEKSMRLDLSKFFLGNCIRSRQILQINEALNFFSKERKALKFYIMAISNLFYFFLIMTYFAL